MLIISGGLLTPLLKQYWEIKAQHQDQILLFRMGDFYEMFFDDAVRAAPIIGIALTSRNKKAQDETPMCGFPYHSVATPINKLLAKGLKVAICEQVEDPKLAKGIVKRAVTRVLTPGMVYDSDLLDGSCPHYLASFEEQTLALIDVTTGESLYYSNCTLSFAHQLLQTLNIAELVVNNNNQFTGLDPSKIQSALGKITLSYHQELSVDQTLPAACRRLLSYVQLMDGGRGLRTINQFVMRSFEQTVPLTATTLKHLEVFQSFSGNTETSLLKAVDRTTTSGGARLLRSHLQILKMSVSQLEAHWDRIDQMKKDLSFLKESRQVLGKVGDLERRLGKVGQTSCNSRDLLSLTKSIEAAVQVLSYQSASQFENLSHLARRVQVTLVEDPPLLIRQGGLIKSGVSEHLDELIELSSNSQARIAAMEESEKQSTGITSLKIRYNQVFGYYIEVSNAKLEKVPAHYLRKQTLSSSERFYTEELLELEKKILSAQAKRNELEFQIYEALREFVLESSFEILSLARQCSEFDLVCSWAWLALERNYTRPQLRTEGLKLIGSRHPVAEQIIQNFIPNDIELSKSSCLFLTGPNMAGKSTLMRQVALSVILAQAGGFVPATSAELPLFDQIFTRIGAHDALGEGLSTFMVEMAETAEMMNQATAKSLLLLDEIGRGTATHDGYCLAQAILEHILGNIRSYVFFATHFHELTNLSTLYPQISNSHMDIVEKRGSIQFLYTLRAGPALKSYGIQVAKLAGLPRSVTQRAEKLLSEKENKGVADNQLFFGSEITLSMDHNSVLEAELESSGEKLDVIITELKSFPIEARTPLQALEQISKWRESLN